MNQLTKNLACEWAGQGIRVNGIAPWYISTELANAVLQHEEYLNSVLARTPMNRVGKPEEVAGALSCFTTCRTRRAGRTALQCDMQASTLCCVQCACLRLQEVWCTACTCASACSSAVAILPTQVLAGHAGLCAGVATFLASRAASYVTGQTLSVDGGYSVMGLQ